ncbi:unnamed protein product, partial [Rotaria sp. Silwood2]
IPPKDYFYFCGICNHDILMGSLVSSRNNICSFKIDDRMSTCGSANINDLKEEDYRFNEESLLVGKFCSSWRKKIFEILFGIHFNNPNNTEVTDRVSDKFYSYFQDIAKQTTLIYNEVFATMKTEQTLEDIQGFVNEYLIYFFLDEENYLPSMINLENNSSIPLILLNNISINKQPIKSNYLDFENTEKYLEENPCDCYRKYIENEKLSIHEEADNNNNNNNNKIKIKSKISIYMDKSI